MHKIQKSILKSLSLKEKSKYSELKPEMVQGNKFSYHLQKILKTGLVTKQKDLYKLTSSGKSFVQKLSFNDLSVRSQPSIITLNICKNKDGKYLLYKRSKQPNINQWGFLSGKIHENETIVSSGKREVFEKSNLMIDAKHKGILYLTFYDKKSELFLSIMAHIIYSEKLHGETTNGNGVSGLEWLSEKEMNKKDLMPGVKEVLKEFKKQQKRKILKDQIFYKEMFIHV